MQIFTKKNPLRNLSKNFYGANFPYTRLYWARLKPYADYGYANKAYANSVYAFIEHDQIFGQGGGTTILS